MSLTLAESIYMVLVAEHARRDHADQAAHEWAARVAREAAKVWNDTRPPAPPLPPPGYTLRPPQRGPGES